MFNYRTLNNNETKLNYMFNLFNDSDINFCPRTQLVNIEQTENNSNF